MFGMMEAMLGFLRRQIGLRTDSASASGSLHAKTAYAASRLNATVDSRYPFPEPKYHPFYYLGKIQPAVNVWQAMLNITNKSGYISEALLLDADSTASYHIRLTVDGVVTFYIATGTGYYGSNKPSGIVSANSVLSAYFATSSYPEEKIGVWYRDSDKLPRLMSFSRDVDLNAIYPSPSTQWNKLLIIDLPIYWSSSFKLECMTSYDREFQISYRGAVAA